MNYSYLPDLFYSSPWISYGFIFVYAAVILLLRKKIFPNPKRWVGKAIFIYAIPVLLLLTNSQFNPGLLGYGKPDGVASLTVIDGNLYVQDYLLAGGGKTYTPSYCYRMHIVDPLSGTKKRRFSIRNAYRSRIIFVHGDTMALSQPDAILFYSTTTGEKINEWSEKTLPGLFPQLASGVKNLEPNDAANEIGVSSLNGNRWTLNVRGNSIVPYMEHSRAVSVPTNKIYLEDKHIRVANDGNGYSVIDICTIKGSDHKGLICKNDSILNRHTVFLKGEIVALSLKDSCFVVRDYDNINRIGVDYTCMSLDGTRKLWDIRESVLRPGDQKEKPIKESACIDEQDGVFFASMVNEVFAIRIADGKLLWRQVP